MVDATLKTLNVWYGESTQGSERPKLLSKLSTLELCGWLEVEFDRLIRLAQVGRLDDLAWVNAEIINKTFGCSYGDHFRPMLVKLVGEFITRRIEHKLELNHPGELEHLKSLLGTLWKIRCSYAHADVHTNTATQLTFQAPSWAINQHRILVRCIGRYEIALTEVLSGL